MSMPTAEFYRLDPLTGSRNFLSFVETLDSMASQEKKQAFSILYADLNGLTDINKAKGHLSGDSAIRWLSIVLQEECRAITYRTGADEFALILSDGTQTDNEELLHRVFARLNKEGEQLELPSPPATVALIHFDTNNDFSIFDVIFHLGETIYEVKKDKSIGIQIFLAHDLLKSSAKAEEQSSDTVNHSWEVLRSIATQSIWRILLMGLGLDDALKNSYHDSISGLPNMRAALMKLEKDITAKQPFAILLIDGDNIRTFNKISYAAGDELIYNMGRVLSSNLRPQDFIARWRTGDEFIAILPSTDREGAKIVGERFCEAIREASQGWKFPTSITIGIAIYPQNGDHVNALVDIAEAANKRGKDEGKDRVILAE